MLSYQTCVTFLSLSYLLTLCFFLNFSRLIKPLSSYQNFAIFSPFVIYSLFTLSTHPINAPAVHTTNTAFSPLLSCAHLSKSPGVFGHRAILIWGDRGITGGFLEEQPVTFTSLTSPLVSIIGTWIVSQDTTF